MIHERSDRAERPFVHIDCAALSPSLIESELFGHEKGAFTNAVNSRAGRFELADRGTVFLDEIGDLARPLQAKLLRVLEDRQFERLGGNRTLTMRARVIAATHRPIEQLIEQGRFREDLYFRLKVIEITVPPLRERPGDIALVANALLSRIREETHRDIRRISDDAIERLQAYDWPGNVRELENALMRAAIVARGTVIGSDHLALGQETQRADGDLSLASATRRHVKRVVGLLDGDETSAAKRLGISKKELKEHLATD